MAYLDHAATTPILPEAVSATTAAMRLVGNASSLHASGRRARRLVEESREAIAAALGVSPGEVVFTSGGTEADNLAVKGLFWARRAEDPRRTRVITSAVEHHAVLDPVEWLAGHEGAHVEYLPVDRHGRVDPTGLAAAIDRDPASVALVSLMWANNEVGTLQPVADAVHAAHRHGIPVHSDAVQALGVVPLDLGTLPVDAVSLSSHKVGGPHGVGALVLSRDSSPVALSHGGGQERDVRSGTLDVPGIAGFAAAVITATQRRATCAPQVAALRDELVRRVLDAVPDAVLNGAPAELRLPGNAHLSFPGAEGDALLMLLDARGVECSTGSACTAGIPEPSHVLLAMGVDEPTARGSLRFSLGTTSTLDDVDALVAALPEAVARARRAGRISRTPGG